MLFFWSYALWFVKLIINIIVLIGKDDCWSSVSILQIWSFFINICIRFDAFSVQFGHFDILEDEEVRQGLKTFSNWPTYPQLYVKGELVGGLDIVKVCGMFWSPLKYYVSGYIY